MLWFVPAQVPLPSHFLGFDPDSPLTQDFCVYQRHLPHWRVPGRCYFITFRARDSIPLPVMQQMKAEAREWQSRLAQAASETNGQLPPNELAAWREFQNVQMRKLEHLLDESHGECLLRRPEYRQFLVDALHHFEGIRTEMLAYAIMPNHVHVVCRPLDGYTPESLARAWKRHSAACLHQALRRSGSFWQEESFDRIIRDAGHYAQTVRYLAKNPLQARLGENEATVWLHPEILAANAHP